MHYKGGNQEDIEDPIDADSEYNNSKNKSFITFIAHFCWNHKREMMCLCCIMTLLFITAIAVRIHSIFFPARVIVNYDGSKSQAELDFSLVQNTQVRDPNYNSNDRISSTNNFNNGDGSSSNTLNDQQQTQHNNANRNNNNLFNELDRQLQQPIQGQQPEQQLQAQPQQQQQQLFGFTTTNSGGSTSSNTPRITVVPPHVNLNDDSPVRREAVRKAMAHAWQGYKSYAWGKDELKPISRTYKNWVGTGIGLTILDSMSTLIIMDMKTEFIEALDWVTRSLDFNQNQQISVFETTIRAVR